MTSQAHLIDALLHDKPTSTRGHNLLKDLGKVLRDLLEGPLDRLVLAQVEGLDKVVDRVVRLVELLLPGDQLFALLREVVVLLKGLFVDV
jgi:hypothetical protein